MMVIKAELKSKKQDPGIGSCRVMVLEDEVEGHVTALATDLFAL